MREALLTWQLERTLGKRRLLELYLNVVEFGPGVWGVESASRRYFESGPAAATTRRTAGRRPAEPTAWHPAPAAPRIGATPTRATGNGRPSLRRPSDAAPCSATTTERLDDEIHIRKVKTMDWMARAGGESARAAPSCRCARRATATSRERPTLHGHAAGPAPVPRSFTEATAAQDRPLRLWRGPRAAATHRRHQLRPRALDRPRHARAAVPRRRGLGAPPRRRVGRRSRSDLHLRPLGRRSPGGNAARHRLAGAGRPRRRRQGRLRDQRSLRPRAHPSLLPQPGPGADAGGGATATAPCSWPLAADRR